MRTRCAEKISGEDYYRRLRESGIHYGPFFQSITQMWRNNGDVLGEVQVPNGPEADFTGFQIHPGILDAGLQVLGAAVAAEATEIDRQGLYLPTRIDHFRVHGRPGRHLWSHARVQHREADATTGEVQLLDEAGRVAIEIQGLRFEYLGEDTQRAAVDNLDDWLYEFQWQPKDLAAGKPSAPASRASWLIFTDSGGVGDAFSALLEARGERSILVARGESYEQTDGEHYRIRPERPEDIRRLFEAALVSDQPGCRGVVHLWSLDVARPEETTVASLNAAQTLGCGSVLLLVQELARTESPDPPRLWLITRGAQAAGEKCYPLSVAQSPLWGLGRVIAQEHRTFWGGLVDLEPGASLRDAAAHQLWRGNLQCGWRGSTCVSSRAAIRGPFGPPAPIGHASPSRPVADGRQLSDQRRTRGPRPLGRALDGRARGAAVDPFGTHQAPAALELEFSRNRKSPGPSNHRHSGTGIFGSMRASGVGRCGG